MKNIYSVSKLLLFLFGMLLGITSCVRPDMDDCPQENVRIVVKTILETSRATTDGYDIENVSIYVFDEQNKFTDIWQGDAYTHGQVYEARMNIKPGNYHFVVWTNLGDTYNTNHTATECREQQPLLNSLMLYMECPANGRVESDIKSLHHSILTDATVENNKLNEFTIVLTPNTNKLNFTITGLESCEDEYSFSVTDNNSHYNFDNSIVDNRDIFKYYRTAKFSGNEIKSSMNVLRITSERSPLFEFSNTNTGELLYSKCLVEMIKQAYAAKDGGSVDFDQTDEFDILLEFDTNLGVTVSINGWKYVEKPTEL